MNAIQSLAVNSVWVIGLAALLATLSYLDWYRSVRKWTFRETFLRPGALAPLNISLACFSGGLLLSELYFNPIALDALRLSHIGKPVLWAIFTAHFIYQSIRAVTSGLKTGWDVPAEECK